MSKSLVNIKGAKSGLIFSFSTAEASFAEVCAALEEKLLGSGDFFTNAEYIIQDEELFSPQDLALLESIMEKYHLQKSNWDPHNEQPESGEDITFQALGGDSVMVMRGVRSGQKLNIRGNAIVMGDVNPGGEIVATGSILVMGYCRGLLHAGAEGDKSVFILAYNMAAQQLRIAEHVATLPDNLGDTPLKMAALKDESIVITDYRPPYFGAEPAGLPENSA
jgi:septum site-determining protein MinC